MSDSYYELIDASDERGEKFAATDYVRSTWSVSYTHLTLPTILRV